MNSLSFSWIHYEFTIFSQIHYLFGEVTMNKLSFSQIHYEFTIFFANSLWINYLFCKSLENLETKNRHVMTNPLWLISNMRFWLFRPFWGQFLTLSGHDMHRLWIVRKFGIVWWATRLIGIESYAYYVYLAVFQIYDPKMTLFDPLDDLGRP